MLIISDKYDDINVFLNKEVGRGTTIYDAEEDLDTVRKKL